MTLPERILFAAALTPDLPEGSVDRWSTPARCWALANTPTRAWKESRGEAENLKTESEPLWAGHKKMHFSQETNRGAAIGGVSEEGVLDPDLIRWRAGEDGYGGRRSGY